MDPKQMNTRYIVEVYMSGIGPMCHEILADGIKVKEDTIFFYQQLENGAAKWVKILPASKTRILSVTQHHKQSLNNMNTKNKEKELRLTAIESTPAARNSWTDDRGNRHTILSYDEGTGDERVNIQIHLEQTGNYYNVRIEEWDGDSPYLLRMGRGGVTTEKL